MQLRVGTYIDRFRVESVIGEGGMAIVYKVVHRELGTVHAMKVLQLSSAAIQERMLKEGRIQATLQHENVVAVSDVIRVHGVPALVMEYVPGPPLDHLLFSFRPNLAQVDAIIQGILRGVVYAHEKQLIHRDLKLANVLMLSKNGTVTPKITDFGLAKAVDSSTGLGNSTVSGVAMGTPTFMAPEQYRNAKHVDQRADVFSIGAMAYQLVTGRPAYSGDDLIELHRRAAEERYVPVREAYPEVPDRFERAIRGALRANLDDRVQSAAELLAIWRGPNYSNGEDLLGERELWPVGTLETIQKMTPERHPVPLAQPTLTPDPKSRQRDPRQVRAERRKRARRWEMFAYALLSAAIVFLLVMLVGIGVQVILQRNAPPEAPATSLAVTVPPSVASPSPQPTRPPLRPSTSVTPAPAPMPPPTAADTPVDEPMLASTPAPVATTTTTAAPEPSEAETTGSLGNVQIKGVDRAYLKDATGSRIEAGPDVPPGRYTVVAFFDPLTPTSVMEVEVAAGKNLQISCTPSFKTCE